MKIDSNNVIMENRTAASVPTPITGSVTIFMENDVLKQKDSSNIVKDLSATGSTSPGGSTTQIQFNDGGVFGGSADFTFNNTTKTLSLVGVDSDIDIVGVTNEPSAPAASTLRIYSKDVCGRMLPKWIGPSGLNTPVQPALFGNSVTLWTPTTATAGSWMGTVGAGAGTYTTALPTTTNFYTTIKRGRWANVVTTANQVLGQRNTEAMFFRGAVSGQGGFFFFCRFGLDAWTTGGRLFVGFHTSTAVVTAQPSAAFNIAGFGIDAADTAITFMTNDASGVATKTTIAGQPALAANNGYDAFIFAKPNDSNIYFRLDDFNAGTTIINSSVNTNLPVNTTMLTVGALASNAALTPVTSVHLGCNRIYAETDR